eukprot:CAMPEP_0184413620 /NCGR_PEP_ID=MMETSP0738-20130409/7368_1 /TAXON_ID=385413 /ORGANISM="Thalassiosira miniscula, Strain CCMP1093" /LENGTH=69 /DNA_ID=CAMNT_0026772423 /DNA_START=408 /DNA_END=617 /DNA_ORIENTATION=+
MSMRSPVRPEYILMRRISPAPRKNPAAFAKVGAAATAVAANAPNTERRVMPEVLLPVIDCMSRLLPLVP